MKRADRRYRGTRPGGLTPMQVGAVAMLTIFVILLMTTKANSQYCGKGVGEQLYEAVFETEDWS